MIKALLDNDVLLKTSCYRLLDQVVLPCAGSASDFGVLGSARFVVLARIGKLRLRNGSEPACAVAEDFLRNALTLEPTRAEQELAADLEVAAQKQGLALDTGESLLCATAIARKIAPVLTGDKRAIVALERLLDVDCRLSFLVNRLTSLEQLVIVSLGSFDQLTIGRSVCSEPEVDKTLAICFQCSSGRTDRAEWLEGLNSYVSGLRREAPRMLSP